MPKTFGLEFDTKEVYATSLDGFADLVLYTLEDFLFKTKFNDKKSTIYIPFAGVKITQEKKFELDIRKYFNIPQFTFDTNGCLYQEGERKVYVSPEYFAKCFIERAIDVWLALVTLYKLQIKSRKETGQSIVCEDLKGKKAFPHVNFVEIYNYLIAIKGVNQLSNKGLIGLPIDMMKIKLANLEK